MGTCNAPAAYSINPNHNIELALEKALQDIFATMFNVQASIIPHTEIELDPRISSIVGFTGRLSGMLCLHFSSTMACNVASGFLGMPLTEVDETVRDAVGEIGNMLAGGLKKQLSNTDNMFKISIPSVIEGSEYTMRAPANSREVWLGIAAGQCRFKIQLIVEQSQSSRN